MDMRDSPGPTFMWYQHLVQENWMLGRLLFQSIDVPIQMGSWQALRKSDNILPDN